VSWNCDFNNTVSVAPCSHSWSSSKNTGGVVLQQKERDSEGGIGNWVAKRVLPRLERFVGPFARRHPAPLLASTMNQQKVVNVRLKMYDTSCSYFKHSHNERRGRIVSQIQTRKWFKLWRRQQWRRPFSCNSPTFKEANQQSTFSGPNKQSRIAHAHLKGAC